MADGVSTEGATIPEQGRLNFPNKLRFNLNLYKVLHEAPSQQPLPPVPAEPTLSDVMRYGQADWNSLRKGSKDRNDQRLGNYLYELAKFMSKPTEETGYHHVIEIDDNWHIDHGRHRLLAAKALGKAYVEANGLNRWLKIQKTAPVTPLT